MIQKLGLMSWLINCNISYSYTFNKRMLIHTVHRSGYRVIMEELSSTFAEVDETIVI